ncbi:MAG: hypothetical protein JO212_08075 [Acetobacteraceae bacterium]|nr:hypothetical protein [Acetobacteraceae bacterium]
MEVIPLDNLAYAAALLLKKPSLGGCDLDCSTAPRACVTAEQHKRVQFKEKLQVTHGEQIDALGEQMSTKP